MSNGRNFRVIGGGKGKTEGESNINKQIKQHKWKMAIQILLIVAGVMGIAFFAVHQYKNQLFSSVSIIAKADRKLVKSAHYLENHNHLISYSKDGISCTDKNGKSIWNMTYEMQEPIVKMSAHYVAVGDYDGHIIHVINEKGEMITVDTKLPIKDFAISAEGMVAVILDDMANSWIQVFQKNGEKIVEAKATMSKTGYPTAIAISGEVMEVSYLYVDGETMRSSVTFYNFGGIGENSSDHIVSSYDYADTVIPLVGFLNQNISFAVGDNRLMFFEGDKKPISNADILLQEEIQAVYYGEDCIGLVFYDQSGEHKYRLDVYGCRGEKLFSYLIDMDFKDIILANRQAFIYNDLQCVVVSETGKEKFAAAFPERIYYAGKTDSLRKYIVVTEGKIGTLEFK